MFAGVLLFSGANAARVPGLYSAEVALPPDGNMDQAFAVALGKVLVKVTGQRDLTVAGGPEAFGDPAALVRQYRNTAPGLVEVGFDPVALRRVIDAAGLPVWGEDRPVTLVWLAIEAGRGQREILAAERPSGTSMPAADTGVSLQPTGVKLPEVRDTLLTTAAERGLPLVLPLVDSLDLKAVSFSDLWGDFTEPVLRASARYQPNAVLIGRGRAIGGVLQRVRWTLLIDGERTDWEGSVADGPDGAADWLAARLASSSDGPRPLTVRVSGIDSLQVYGMVLNYLRGLGIVDQCTVDQVAGARVVFGLQLRGDAQRLLRTLELRKLLQAADSIPDSSMAPVDLELQWVGSPRPGSTAGPAD